MLLTCSGLLLMTAGLLGVKKNDLYGYVVGAGMVIAMIGSSTLS